MPPLVTRGIGKADQNDGVIPVGEKATPAGQLQTAKDHHKITT